MNYSYSGKQVTITYDTGMIYIYKYKYTIYHEKIFNNIGHCYGIWIGVLL